MHRLGSFFDMMRISSSVLNCTQGVFFCSAVLEKLAGELDPSLTSRGEKPTMNTILINYIYSSLVMSSVTLTHSLRVACVVMSTGYNEWL